MGRHRPITEAEATEPITMAEATWSSCVEDVRPGHSNGRPGLQAGWGAIHFPRSTPGMFHACAPAQRLF